MNHFEKSNGLSTKEKLKEEEQSGKTWVAVLIVVLVILIGAAGFYYFVYYKKNSPADNLTDIENAKKTLVISIPQNILDNKFGFLSAGPEDAKFIKSVGAAWVRPHPGPFLWDAMQAGENSQIDFSQTDEMMKKYQKEKLGILATLWPYAEWDQKNRNGFDKCAVSTEDEFLSRKDKGKMGDMSYLPEHRCNPTNWEDYKKWVSAVVERYDGDGKGDMKGLEIPIKYWEVMNEPDLNGNENLDFYIGKAQDYAKLLTETYQTVKDSDPNSQVLIAGAAGGSKEFLDFYRDVFSDPNAKNSFDITNIHCISNDDYDNFNVAPYKKMLSEFSLENKPIWVTEAEVMISTDSSINATQVLHSTENALEDGAKKIFYTMYDFAAPVGQTKMMPPQKTEIKAEIDGANSEKAYQEIFNQ